jgi:hypothetical protein
LKRRKLEELLPEVSLKGESPDSGKLEEQFIQRKYKEAGVKQQSMCRSRNDG